MATIAASSNIVPAPGSDAYDIIVTETNYLEVYQ